jgi:acyl-CoA thioesterase FadM
MTSPLIDLLADRVSADEIDELGHLSVPFYEARALTASRRLANELGCNLGAYSARGVEFTLVDAYTRNLREQFLDAPLIVRGGPLAASSTRLRFYQEIVNTDHDELAATFVHEFELQRHDTRHAIAYDIEETRHATEGCVDWPAHGRSRSLDLERGPHELSLSTAQTLHLACTRPRIIKAEECDETGLLLRERFSHLPYSGLSAEDLAMEWVFETADGRKLGIADLETRNVLYSLPRVGEQIQTYNATVDIARKIIQRAHWVFNLDSQKPISWATTVSLPLDLEARRSVEIPPSMRTTMEKHHHPDLR